MNLLVSVIDESRVMKSSKQINVFERMEKKHASNEDSETAGGTICKSAH